MNSKLSEFSIMLRLLLFLVLFIPLGIATAKVFTGQISFWYDIARDFLSAWNNLSDPTLIGPTSGIPGIFYGPYWIWLLSIPLIFSKDPRFVFLIVGVVPYFIIFPFLLFKFRKYMEFPTLVILWLLFSTSFGMTYAHNLWNPRVAPILTLLLIWLLLTALQSKNKSIIFLGLSGIVSGIIINVHISFGIGIFGGCVLFLIISPFLVKANKNKQLLQVVKRLSSFGLGVLFSFLPFLLFEIRHNFSQTTTALHALTKFGDVVTVTGLSKFAILTEFIKSMATLLHLPLAVSLIICLVLVVVTGYTVYRNNHHSFEKKLLILLLCCLFFSLFALYLTARNPVWDYHFIGVEIIFLLLFGICINTNCILQRIFLVWSVIVLITTSFQTLKDLNTSYTVSNLRTKTYITDIIGSDASGKEYTVFSYQSSIYQYDYSYLFKWRFRKDVSYDPGQIAKNEQLSYVILPKENTSNSAELKNFLLYQTPKKYYTTQKTWDIPDGSSIVKRVRFR